LARRAESGDTREFARLGQTELGDRGLLSDEIAESKEVGPSTIAGDRIDRTQETDALSVLASERRCFSRPSDDRRFGDAESPAPAAPMKTRRE